MKTGKRVKKVFAGLLAALLLAVTGAGAEPLPVKAAGGSVYTCVIHPCYAHPVTGVIEDSGGEASYTPPDREWWTEPSIPQEFWS